MPMLTAQKLLVQGVLLSAAQIYATVQSLTSMAILQVGRSGRFGHLGLAVNLITYEDRFNL